MVRIARLDDVMFPVGLAPLTAHFDSRDLPVGDSRAVVDRRAGRVLRVVGRDYRLVSHAQALELAFDCARRAFPGTQTAEWQVALVDATSDRAHTDSSKQ